MLSTINWINRDITSGVLDNRFAQAYGASAAAAKQVVDRAINDWQNAIAHFHNGSPGGNTFVVEIYAVDLGGLRGSTAINGVDPFLKPLRAAIRLSDDVQYFDTVQDDGEFDQFVDSFAAVNTGIGTNDLYSTVLHELGHALGITTDSPLLKISERLTPTGIADPRDNELELYRFNGPSITATMMGQGADGEGDDLGHIWEGTAAGGTIGTLPIFPNRLLNSGRSRPDNMRKLISDVELRILKDAYGYDVNLPVTNSFLMNFNASTGVVTVNGPAGASADTIRVNVDASGTFSATVNGFVETVPWNAVTSLRINGGAGSDTFDVERLPGNKFIYIDGGAGSDTIRIAPGSRNLDDIDSSIDVADSSVSESNTLELFDQNNGFGDTYLVTGGSIARDAFPTLTYSGFDHVTLNAGYGTNVINVTTAQWGTKVRRGGGDDVIFTSLEGPVAVEGEGGTDEVIVTDNGSLGSGDYYIVAGSLEKLVIGYARFVSFDPSIERVTLQCDNIDSIIQVHATSPATTVIVDGRGGNDVLQYTESPAMNGPLTFRGGAGTDTASISDPSTASQSYTLTSSSLTRAGAGGLTYDNAVEGITFDAGSAGDTITIGSTSAVTPVTLRGNGGSDAFNLTPATHNLATVVSRLTINGGSGADDRVDVYDDGVALGSEYVFNNATLSRNGFGGLTYGALDRLALHAQSNDNVIRIDSTGGPAITVNAGDGKDTIYVGAGDLGIAGLGAGGATVNGQGGSDSVIIQDQAVGADYVYTLTGTSLARPSSFGCSFATAEEVTLRAGNGSDTINVNGTAPLGAVYIQAGGGNDAVHLAAAGNNLAAVAAPISVNGGDGIDAVVLHDAANPSAALFNFTSYRVQRSGSGLVTHDDFVESLTVEAGGGNNLFDFVGTAIDATVRAGGGSDTFRYGFAAGRVDGINGTANIDGGGGSDRAMIYDASYTGFAIVTLTPSFIDTSHGARAAHANLEWIEYDGGSGGSLIDVTPADAIEFTVHGNNPSAGTPADALNLQLAGVMGAVPTETALGAGHYDFANRRPVNFTGIEYLAQLPFLEATSLPARIQAEDFDFGGETVSFHDADASNNGGYYRTTPVDIASTDGTGDKFLIGWTESGEWLEYTIDAPDLGVFDVITRVACPAAGARFHIEFDGVDCTGSLAVPNTGGWYQWADVVAPNVRLTPGQHVMRLSIDAGSSAYYAGNFDYFRFTPVQASYTPIPAAIPGRIETENFDTGGQDLAFNDLSPQKNEGGQYRNTAVDIEPAADAAGGGAFNVGWTHGGEWLEYTVDVAQTGNYDLVTRVASAGTGGAFHVEFDGVDKTSTLNVANTGGWHSWIDLRRAGISLTAGRHVMRLAFDADGATGYIGNFNYLSLTPASSVAAVRVFYNNSAADGLTPGPSPQDDAAIDPLKSPLLAGAVLSPANVTGYAKGINGAMIDVLGLPASTTTLSVADFTVRSTSPASPNVWGGGPPPSQVGIRRGAGVDGSDRITLTWSDAAAVKNSWVEVTVRANASTGLLAAYTFAFGNLVADANGDRTVGPGDFNILATHFGQTGQMPSTGDFDGDRTVGPGDFNLLATRFGTTLPPPPPPSLASGAQQLRPRTFAPVPATLDAAAPVTAPRLRLTQRAAAGLLS